jgi:hypothetical protein
LGDIFRPEVLPDRRKRDRSIGKAVLEHGYTQGEVADYLGAHFTSVSRVIGARYKTLRKTDLVPIWCGGMNPVLYYVLDSGFYRNDGHKQVFLKKPKR